MGPDLFCPGSSVVVDTDKGWQPMIGTRFALAFELRLAIVEQFFGETIQHVRDGF